MPDYEIARCQQVPRESIKAFLRRARWTFKTPTICIVNGVPLARAKWARYRIKARDAVVFLSRPGRSGLGSILGLVALLALAVFLPVIVPALLGAGLAATTIVGGLTVGGLVSSGLLLGGSLLIAALTAPKAGGLSNDGSGDQIQQLYSIAASGNIGKLFDTIPVGYGRLKDFPNFAATPWAEYIGNDQYLNLLFNIGCGKYAAEKIYIDETVLWDSSAGVSNDFTGVDLAFYGPGENVGLFPVNVVASGEVSGQALAVDPIGGFVATAPGVAAKSIAVDLVFPSGCFSIHNTTGEQSSKSVTVQAQYAAVDDAGAFIGGYQTLFSKTFTFNTKNPQRVSVKTDVAAGRYTVKVSRTDAPAGTVGEWTAVNDVVWAALRAFIDGPTAFPGVTTLALRIKATDQLNQSSAKKFAVLRTRILPVWNGSAWVDTPTRSPFWAFYDMAVNTDYGAKRPPSKIDFQAIADGAAGAVTRGDSFDYIFTAATIVPDAFDTALKVARARHRWAGDVLSCVRDEAVAVPQMLLTDREIVRGTLAMPMVFNAEDQSDSVILEYIDENTWGLADVQYPPNDNDFSAQNPAKIRIDGIVNRAHAYRETTFYFQQAYYRRVSIELDTEHDGRLLGYGAHIRVQSELPQTFGQAGAVDVDASSGSTLALTPAPDWSAGGQKYLEIRSASGGRFGPVKCSRPGSDDGVALLDATDLAAVEAAQGMILAEALARTASADDPSFVFGIGDSLSKDCIVLGGRPNGERVSLSLVVDDPAVHAQDPDPPPTVPAGSLLTQGKVPVIAGLSAWFGQGVIEPRLYASWFPAAGALYYVADVSYDAGGSWNRLYEGNQPAFSLTCERANLRLRVAGVGVVLHGGFTYVDVAVPEISASASTVSLAAFKAGLADYVTGEFQRVTARFNSLQQIIGAAGSEQDAQNFLDKYQANVLAASTIEGVASAKVEAIEAAETYADGAVAAFGEIATATFETQAASASAQASTLASAHSYADGAVATLSAAVDASIGDTNASVAENSTAIAQLDGFAAAAWSVKLNANGYVAGVQLVNGGSGSSYFDISADVFRIAWPGVSGGSPSPVFQIANVNGVAKLAFRGDAYFDGVLTARMIQTGEVKSVAIESNAATYISYVAGGSGSAGNTTVTLASLTFPVAVGPIMIEPNVYLGYLGDRSIGATLKLLIDGSVVDSYNPSFTPIGSAQYYMGAIFPLPVVANLSVGNHTIAYELTTSGGDGPISYSKARLMVLESRR